jgi:protein-tyrosine phosphatase
MIGPAKDRHDGVGRAARLLTVCLGNICRSPTAEAALVEAAAELGLDVEVASAGTGDWHLGHPPNPPMQAAAAQQGLELRGTAQQVDAELLAWADLVLVMDRSNLADVTRIANDGGVATPIALFRRFDPELNDARGVDGSPYGSGPDEVPDPYGGGPEGFDDVVRICRRTARAIVLAWPDIVGDLVAQPEQGGRR